MSELKNLSNDTKILTNEGLSWLQKHEKLVLVFMSLVVLFFVLEKSLDIVSKYEDHRASTANAIVEAQKVKNETELTQAKQFLSDYQSTLAQTVKANEALSTAITTREKVVVVQQKADAQMQPSQLAQRWQDLIHDPGVTATTDGFNLTDSAALTTVQQLEEVPILQLNLEDERSKEANLQETNDKAKDLIDQGKIVVNGLKLELTEKAKSCTIDLDAEKAKGRKGKIKAFGIGYAAGFVSGIILHFVP
jgi:beta-xylosidase